MEEIDELAQFGVLEVLRIADDIALVRCTFVSLAVDKLRHVLAVVVGIHVVLLKHVLQLRLESTENGVRQTIRIEGEPTLHLV